MGREMRAQLFQSFAQRKLLPSPPVFSRTTERTFSAKHRCHLSRYPMIFIQERQGVKERRAGCAVRTWTFGSLSWESGIGLLHQLYNRGKSPPILLVPPLPHRSASLTGTWWGHGMGVLPASESAGSRTPK